MQMCFHMIESSMPSRNVLSSKKLVDANVALRSLMSISVPPTKDPSIQVGISDSRAAAASIILWWYDDDNAHMYRKQESRERVSKGKGTCTR